MKKVISLVLALMMILSLSVTAFAAETTYTLTINNETDGHTYEAYQIFAGDLSESEGNAILANIEWGTGISNPTAFLADIQADAKLSVLHPATDAASLAALLATVSSDSETLDQFAEIVGKHLGTVAGTSTDAGNHYAITGLTAGYYLVKDRDNSLASTANDVYTKFIIRVIRTTSVTPKGDVPSVTKTINDTLGGTFAEAEDFDINDTVYYKWTGTLPTNLAAYETYSYKFIDNLPTGIVFNQFEQIYLEGHDGNVVHTFYDLHDADTANDTIPSDIVTEITASNVSLKINDLLTLYPHVMETHKIVVKYTARVTRDALIADKMTNTVKVEYSNNPNGNGDGNVGTTPEDVAHAFTFKITVDKYDADNAANKLEGAEFVLYYQRIEDEVPVKYYAKVITEEMIANGEVINGVAVDADDLGIVYGWTTDKAEASVLDTDANGALTVKGLDSGIFYLEETKAPTGYNLMETPVQISIAPAYNADGTLASLTYAVDSIAQGSSDTVGVRNSSGSTLPITGGIGTTIFYILGGLMVTGAAVLLITKKRMAV